MSKIKGRHTDTTKIKNDEALFFIAVIPPLQIQEQVTQLKEEIRDKYHSKHALNSPPHITLHMPFRWKVKKLQLLIDTMKGLSNIERSFDISLKGFDVFAPRVIFIDVSPNDQLGALQKNVTTLARRKLGLDNADYKNRGFHPHMTIGFRDLKKSKFLEAWEYFQNRTFNATFRVENLTLLKHENRKWNVYQEFPLIDTSN